MPQPIAPQAVARLWVSRVAMSRATERRGWLGCLGISFASFVGAGWCCWG